MISTPAAPSLNPDGPARPLGTVIAVASVALLLMPFFSTFGELLTSLATAIGLDAALGQWVAPTEARLAHGVLTLIGLQSSVAGPILSVGAGGRGVDLYISWNCVGWQTLIFFALSLTTGLSGEYTLRSRIETAVLGVAGIVALNIARITVVALVALAFGRVPAIIVHDYGSIVATVVFLMGFWTLAYAVVLERLSDGAA